MKPIFTITVIHDQPITQSYLEEIKKALLGDAKKLSEEYHVIICCIPGDKAGVEYNLLNGTEENFKKVSEFIEKHGKQQPTK